MSRRATRTSRQLSWLLRHGADEVGLAMDAAGWADVSAVQAVLDLSRSELEDAVRTNDKGRLELDGDRIRACQGHSLAGTPVTRGALEASWQRIRPEASLWHGTKASLVEAITTEGIRPGARTHVHLAPSPTSRVGKRARVEVLVEVGPACLAAHGVAVFRAPNGVLLVREVPPACIVGVHAADPVRGS